MLTFDELAPDHSNQAVARVWAQYGCAILPWKYSDGPRRRKVPVIKGWRSGEALVGEFACGDFWAQNTNAFPGIITGVLSGVWVLDLDTKNGVDGVAAFKRLVKEHTGQETLGPEFLRVKTPTGGWHVYFKMPADGRVVRNSQGKLGPGIDVRGEGGYVAAPGTIVAAGQVYSWPDTFNGWYEAPEWLLELVLNLPADNAWNTNNEGATVTSTEALAAAKPGEQDGKLFGFLAAQHRAGVPAEQALQAAWPVVQAWELGDPSDPWTHEDVEAKVRSIWSREEYRNVTPQVPVDVQAALRRLASSEGNNGSAMAAPNGNTAVETAEAAVTSGRVPQSAEVQAQQDAEEDQAAVLPDGFRATESGNALRLVALADGRIRFVHAWSKWVVYDGGRWWVDTGDARVRELAKGVAARLLRLAGDESIRMDSMDRQAVFKFGLRAESASQIGAMVNLARGIPGILIDHNELDHNSHLLNCLNGTVDLRTGELRAHDPDDLMMMQCPVVYDPAAASPLWDRLLSEWLPDVEVREFLQRAVGSGATGIPVEALIVNVGKGGNGKSKFFGAVADVLGPFAVVPHKSLITVQKHDPHPTVRASLFRARLLLVPETSQGDRLNEESIKDLTGGDRIKGRRMREDEWEFLPTHTLFMHTNHKPRITGGDEGIWRRVKLVDWKVTIPKAQRDEHLAEKLRAPEVRAAVLRWIVEGAVWWYREGLAEPESVVAASDEYRDDSDTVSAFVTDTRLEFAPDLWTASSTLSQTHAAWFSSAGIPGRAEYHYQQLSAWLKEQSGVSAKKSAARGGRYWEGLGWRVSEGLEDT